MQLDEVIHFLEQQNIHVDVFYKNQKISKPYKKDYIVSYQKPLAGSLIGPNHQLHVQLQVM